MATTSTLMVSPSLLLATAPPPMSAWPQAAMTSQSTVAPGSQRSAGKLREPPAEHLTTARSASVEHPVPAPALRCAIHSICTTLMVMAGMATTSTLVVSPSLLQATEAPRKSASPKAAMMSQSMAVLGRERSAGTSLAPQAVHHIPARSASVVPPVAPVTPASALTAAGSTPTVTAVTGMSPILAAVVTTTLLSAPPGTSAAHAAVAPAAAPVKRATLWTWMIHTETAGMATTLISTASPTLPRVTALTQLSASPLAATMSRLTAAPGKERSAGASMAIQAERLTTATCASEINRDICLSKIVS